MQTQVLLTIEHDKPIKDIQDVAAGRMWSCNGVVTAFGLVVTPKPASAPDQAAKISTCIFCQQVVPCNCHTPFEAL